MQQTYATNLKDYIIFLLNDMPNSFITCPLKKSSTISENSLVISSCVENLNCETAINLLIYFRDTVCLNILMNLP